jgi:hypothetical protein
MLLSALAPPNALFPMDVTLAGMVMVVRPTSQNEQKPMDVSWLPATKVTEVSVLVP